MNNAMYESITFAKNGTPIPQLKNGRTVDSRYNPEKEAETLLINIKNTVEAEHKPGEQGENFYHFFVLAGVGCAIFAEKLCEAYPESRILAIEKTQEDLDLLEQLPSVKNLKKKKNVFFCEVQHICDALTSSFLPVKYSSPVVIEQKAWCNENADLKPFIQQEINRALRIISADYSVQAHFGKIWMHNILNNLCTFSDSKIIENQKKLLKKIDISKKALVVAAGPSLDNQIKNIRSKKDDFFIISTDTANSTLINYECPPDAVISLDGQAVSCNHFIKNGSDDCIYFFDLCANSSAAKKLCAEKKDIAFFCSGHPLAHFANNFSQNQIPYVFAGAGTVTIAAVDLAYKLGFSRIEVVGADFCYSNHKAYTSGTYLDTLYNLNSTKLFPTETQFSRLMFRTPLLKNQPKKQSMTTEVLQAYRNSFLDYLSANHIAYEYKNDVYTLYVKEKCAEPLHFGTSFNYKAFMAQVRNVPQADLETCLLPFMAWLKNNFQKRGESVSYDNLLKLAQTFIVRYNIIV